MKRLKPHRHLWVKQPAIRLLPTIQALERCALCQAEQWVAL